jgi:DnaA family protein
MGVQLPLNIRLTDGASFDNYYPGPNREILHCLRRSLQAEERCTVYLWGGAGVGKTHLLQAACRQLTGRGAPSVYLPLAEEIPQSVLDGLDRMALVCLDDLQACTGRGTWEHVLFTLYNRCQEAGTQLLLAANAPPASLGLALPDLVSRLSWGLVLHVRGLSERDKVAALRHRARGRGLDLPVAVASFLLRRCPRDLPFLFGLLDRIDLAAFAAHRQVTIPFVKGVLESGDR